MSPARALAHARAVGGLLFLARTTPLGAALPRSFSPGEWVGATDHAAWTVTVLGPRIPWSLVIALVAVRTLAAVLFTVGFHARASGLVAAAAGAALLLQDRFAFVNALHVLFLGTAALALAQPSASASAEDPHGALGARFLARFLATIYFWAGAAKLSSGWLSGHVLALASGAGAFLGPLGPALSSPGVRSLVAPAIPVLELAAAVLLVLDRRRAAVVAALAFHLAVELTVVPSSLGWQMALLLWAVWPRDHAPRRDAC